MSKSFRRIKLYSSIHGDKVDLINLHHVNFFSNQKNFFESLIIIAKLKLSFGRIKSNTKRLALVRSIIYSCIVKHLNYREITNEQVEKFKLKRKIRYFRHFVKRMSNKKAMKTYENDAVECNHYLLIRKGFKGLKKFIRNVQFIYF